MELPEKLTCSKELRDKLACTLQLPQKVIKLRSLNPHVVCLLCAGYFVEATTIVECLHTFCKSCIVRYLQSSKFCPTCGILVHETDPLSTIKPDRTMQDIMEKILPNIKNDEKRREEEFMKNITGGKMEESEVEYIEDNNKQKLDLSNFPCSYKHNEQFNLCLELDCNSDMCLGDIEVVEIHNKYIRCAGRVRVVHLKKLISKFYEPYCAKFELKVKCNNHQLDDTDHLKLIYVLYWKRKAEPMVLHYGFRKWNDDVRMIMDNCISKVESNGSNDSEDVKNCKTTKLNKILDETNDDTAVPPAAEINALDASRLHEEMSCDDDTTSCSDISNFSDTNPTSYNNVSNSFTNNSNVCLDYPDDKLKLYKQANAVCGKLNLDSRSNSLDSFKQFSGGIVSSSLLFTSNHGCLTVT